MEGRNPRDLHDGSVVAHRRTTTPRLTRVDQTGKEYSSSRADPVFFEKLFPGALAVFKGDSLGSFGKDLIELWFINGALVGHEEADDMDGLLVVLLLEKPAGSCAQSVCGEQGRAYSWLSTITFWHAEQHDRGEDGQHSLESEREAP